MILNQVAISILQTPAGLASESPNPSAQATSCWQSAIIQLDVQNPDLRSKSLNIYWNKGALLKLETNFCFKYLCRVSSLRPSGIWRHSWILNFRSLSCAESARVSRIFKVRKGSHSTAHMFCPSVLGQNIDTLFGPNGALLGALWWSTLRSASRSFSFI